MLTEKDKIKHLYHRAAFGLTVNDWQSKNTWQQFLDELFKAPEQYNTLQTVTLAEVEEAMQKIRSGSKEDIKDLKQMLKKNVFELNNLWLNEMIRSESQLQEKMSLFWHGHFACRSANPYFDQQYLEVIRKN